MLTAPCHITPAIIGAPVLLIHPLTMHKNVRNDHLLGWHLTVYKHHGFYVHQIYCQSVSRHPDYKRSLHTALHRWIYRCMFVLH